MVSYTVRRDRRYCATIRLGMLERLAGNEMIAERLRRVGFVDVEVEGTGAIRHATARWPKDDASAEMPVQISMVNEIE